MLTLSANVAGEDLSGVAKSIDAAIRRAGAPPTGTSAELRGQIPTMRNALNNLGVGLLLAILTIFLLLAANYESLRLSFVVLTTAPGTLCGVILILLMTHTTLNIESYMGAIMAVGVGTANAILLVTFADQHRKRGATAIESGIHGVKERMRPILMTSVAMIAGMIPMALATEVTAPLGKAVIGGLVAATLTNLTVLPFVFSIVERNAKTVPLIPTIPGAAMRRPERSELTTMPQGQRRNLPGLTAVAAVLTVCLALNSCTEKENSAVPPLGQPASGQSLPQVELTAVKSQKLSATISLPTELMPYEAIDVYTRETGFVKSIKVDRGSSVRQGELIAELDAPELLAQRAQATAAFQSAQAQLAAVQAKLAADQATYQHMSAASKTPGVVAANDLDIAQRSVQSDEANVAALQKTAEAAEESLKAVTQLVSYLNITAPFDGRVTNRYVHPGALVGPAGGSGATTPIVRIETLNRLRLVVPVPENNAAGVPEGTRVSLTAPLFPGRTFRAPIARISHDIDTKTRTMPVELDVRDPLEELVPGTFCEVEWPVHRTYPTLFVPVSAVASDWERTFVIRVANNRTEWVDVRTGTRVGDSIEVFGDLHPGDEVATHGTDQLRAGTQVSSRLVNQ